MADSRTVPILPCRSIDDIIDFYQMLGFERTYRQQRPNPYAAVKRGDIELHFFGMAEFDPAGSYGSCLVVVSDLRAIYEAFAACMRAEYGTLLVSGLPRMTRPRERKNNRGLSGFSVVDPGGNWIRFTQTGEDASVDKDEASRVAQALANAIVLGESKGSDAQAAKILDSTLARHAPDAPAVDLVEALAYRAELAVRLDDRDRATALLNEIDEVSLSDEQRQRLVDALATVADLRQALMNG